MDKGIYKTAPKCTQFEKTYFEGSCMIAKMATNLLCIEPKKHGDKYSWNNYITKTKQS